jgi:hypothetical protein
MKYLPLVYAMVLSLLASEALAARYALVIGINDYENVPKLAKAVGDAEAMAARLTSLGFTVTKALNPNRRALNQAISTLQKQVKPGDDVLVHFSGHGVELDGNNLLLPADVPLPDSSDKDFLISEAISLSDLMQRISDTHAAVKVFVIDACRDNPFATKGRSIGTARGLSIPAPVDGSFVLYSAGRGQTALDSLGNGDSAATSVYTRVLIDVLGRPGLSLTEIAKSVRKQVATLAGGVNHQQQPAYYDEMKDDSFYFAGKGSVAADTPAPLTSGPTTPSEDATRQAYEDARSLNTVEAWEAFRKYHKQGYYADLAAAAVAKLTQSDTVPDVSINDARALVALISSDEPATDLYDFVTTTYADRVNYYGKPASRGDVLADKQKWYARWSSWSVKPHYDTLTVAPGQGGLFDVSYVLDYQWNPASGGDPVAGTARARLTVVKRGGKLVIVDETSDVLSEQSRTPQPANVADLGPLVLDMPDVDGNYFVFLGAFRAQDRAENKRRQLGSLSGRAEIISTSDYVGLTRDLWAATIGPLSRHEAGEILAMAKLKVPDAYVRQTRQKRESAATGDIYYLVGLVPTGDNWLALRTSPDTSTEIVAKMGPTTLLRVISRSGDWNHVEILNTTLRNSRGWASRKYMACCL